MPQYNRASATLPVSDVDAAKEFYGGTLGLELVEENAGGTYYQAGSSTVFVYPSQFAGTNQATAAGFEVNDIEAAVADVGERGRAELSGLRPDVVEQEHRRRPRERVPDHASGRPVQEHMPLEQPVEQRPQALRDLHAHGFLMPPSRPCRSQRPGVR